MAAFGETLRAQREAQGVSLDEICAATRISTQQLEALEAEQFEQLPGGVFNVSFARQYARYVDFDEDEAAEGIKRAMASKSVAVENVPDLALFEIDEGPRPADPYLGGGPVAKLAEWSGEFLHNYGPALGNVAIGLVLVFGGLYSFQLWEAGRAAPTAVQSSVEAGDNALVAEASLGDDESGVASIPAERSEPQLPIELSIQVVETVWVRAVADGDRVFEEIFKAGDTRPIGASREVLLKVGNAGGVLLQLNGQALPSLGPRGHVRSVIVRPDGMEILDAEPRRTAPSDAQHVPTTTASVRWAELAWSRATR